MPCAAQRVGSSRDSPRAIPTLRAGPLATGSRGGSQSPRRFASCSWTDASLDDDPLEQIEVVGKLHQLDILPHRPGQCLLMKRNMADVVAVDLERLGDHRVALGLI